MLPRGVAYCKACHAPLPEDVGHIDDTNLPPRGQLPISKLGGHNDVTEGVTCAVCHVRDNVRHGPPNPSATLAKILNYPVVYDKRYMRADFCLPCHQFPAENNVDIDHTFAKASGKRPVADVYMEWLFGPYARRGIQCQSCHMPNREHTWKGGRDTETVRQGIKMAAAVGVEGDVLSVEVKLANVGCGHSFPGGWEAAGHVFVELVNGNKVIATAEKRIGRDLVRGESGWLREYDDTRIPPDVELVFAPSFEPTVARAATYVRVTFMMSPADNRVRIFTKKLADTKGASAEDIAYYRQQLEYYRGMEHEVYRQELPIGKPRVIPARHRYPK